MLLDLNLDTVINYFENEYSRICTSIIYNSNMGKSHYITDFFPQMKSPRIETLRCCDKLLLASINYEIIPDSALK